MTHRMPRKNRHEKNVPKHKKCSGTFSFIVREILFYLATSHPFFMAFRLKSQRTIHASMPAGAWLPASTTWEVLPGIPVPYRTGARREDGRSGKTMSACFLHWSHSERALYSCPATGPSMRARRTLFQGRRTVCYEKRPIPLKPGFTGLLLSGRVSLCNEKRHKQKKPLRFLARA